MNNRLEVKEYILNLEANFPVDKWEVNGLHIWPIIRINLYFAFIYGKQKIEKNRSTINKSFAYKLRSYVYHLRKYYLHPLKLKQKKQIFSGAIVHREKFNGLLYNRFFDTYIDSNALKEKSLFFELGPTSNIENYHNSDILIKTQENLFSYKFLFRKRKNLKLESKLEGFDLLLEKLAHLEEKINIDEFSLEYLNSLINNVLLEVDFYKKMLRKVKPERVSVLCYYSVNTYPLVIAANQLGITTIEYQHGPQTNKQLAYSNWTKVPLEGYSFLPKEFWCWDSTSAETIRQWTKEHELYKVSVKGNFWTDKWKYEVTHVSDNSFILYTLQPEPLSLDMLFAPSILTTMNSSEQTWLLRLHPRQKETIEEIKHFISGKVNMDVVDFEQANSLPLPILLSKCLCHVTHFSGSAIEASYFDKKTIFLNEISIWSFDDLIKNKDGFYINPFESNFEQSFNERLKSILLDTQA